MSSYISAEGDFNGKRQIPDRNSVCNVKISLTKMLENVSHNVQVMSEKKKWNIIDKCEQFSWFVTLFK